MHSLSIIYSYFLPTILSEYEERVTYKYDYTSENALFFELFTLPGQCKLYNYRLATYSQYVNSLYIRSCGFIRTCRTPDYSDIYPLPRCL